MLLCCCASATIHPSVLEAPYHSAPSLRYISRTHRWTSRSRLVSFPSCPKFVDGSLFDFLTQVLTSVCVPVPLDDKRIQEMCDEVSVILLDEFKRAVKAMDHDAAKELADEKYRNETKVHHKNLLEDNEQRVQKRSVAQLELFAARRAIFEPCDRYVEALRATLLQVVSKHDIMSLLTTFQTYPSRVNFDMLVHTLCRHSPNDYLKGLTSTLPIEPWPTVRDFSDLEE
eukprot:m.366050 g.366050  ORF g.366050 m.366050 type:complete len:228 (-) comp16658_c2_seq12:89-772(-)